MSVYKCVDFKTKWLSWCERYFTIKNSALIMSSSYTSTRNVNPCCTRKWNDQVLYRIHQLLSQFYKPSKIYKSIKNIKICNFVTSTVLILNFHKILSGSGR